MTPAILIIHTDVGYCVTLTMIAGKCKVGLTAAQLIKVVADYCNKGAILHDNSRALYVQALQTRVNQQYMQAYR
jgi:hypothetical protein